MAYIEATGTVRALYVLYPIPEAEALPIRSVDAIPTDGNGIVARITFLDGSAHHAILADRQGQSRAGEMDTDGEAAWVAVDDSGKVVRTILVEGTELKFEGTQVSVDNQV